MIDARAWRHTASKGHCGVTTDMGDCIAGTSGSFGAAVRKGPVAELLAQMDPDKASGGKKITKGVRRIPGHQPVGKSSIVLNGGEPFGHITRMPEWVPLYFRVTDLSNLSSHKESR